MNSKKKIRLTIGFKLISIISFVIIAALGAMIFLATYFFRIDNEVRAKEMTLDRSELISLKVKTDFESLARNSEQILEKRLVLSPEALFENDPDIVCSALVVREGEAFSFAGSVSNPAAMEKMAIESSAIDSVLTEEREKIEKAFLTETLVFNVSPLFNAPVICIARPFELSSQIEAASVHLTIVSMNRFLEAVKSASIYKSFIINGDGDLVAHYDESLVLTRANIITLPIVDMMLKSSSDNGQTRYVQEGEAFLGSFKKTGFSDTGVITTVQESVAFAAVYRIQKRNILIAVIIVNVAIFIVFVFAKSLVRPVKRLAEASERIKNGDFNVTIQTTTSDEIADLTRSFIEMGKGLAEREKMKDAFGKFVNKEIAEQILKGEVKLGGERKQATVFFSDIRDFTAISENLEPEEVVEMLNGYMTRMVDCVNRTNGVVDKFIGDAVMAVWGAPISHGNDTENAINGALMMRKALMEFNESRGGPRKPKLRIGCGINCGPLLAGQIGSEQKMEYTVIGDTVNLASRVESLNKPFGTDILISEDAYRQTRGVFVVEEMKKIKVKGKSEEQRIYAVIRRSDDLSGPKTLQEVRDMLGIPVVADRDVDSEGKEIKYEIIDDIKRKTTAMTGQAAPHSIIKKNVKYETLD